MTKLFGKAALLALGMSVALFSGSVANAQQVERGTQVQSTTEGRQILNQSRGRVGRGGGGGPRRVYRGGGGGPRHGHRRGRGAGYIAGGAAAAIIGGIIVNEAIRSSRPRYSRGELSCGQLEYRCSRGSDWACQVLEDDPHC